MVIKIMVFWDVTPCSLLDTHQHLRGGYCHLHQGRCAVIIRDIIFQHPVALVYLKMANS
jgi:hypothetical protein